MLKHTGLVLVVALLAGCASPTAYMAAAKPGANGYSESQIESDRFRVTFRTAAGGARYAEDMALRRAAELTLARGFDWFFVNNRFAQNGANSGPSLSVGTGFGSFGRHSSVGVGTSVGIPLGGPGPAADASIEVRLGKGPKPDDPAAYDAREIVRSLGPRTPV